MLKKLKKEKNGKTDRKYRHVGRRLINARVQCPSRRTREIFTQVMDVDRFKFIFHGRLLLTVSIRAGRSTWLNLPPRYEDSRWTIGRENLADEMSDIHISWNIYINLSPCESWFDEILDSFLPVNRISVTWIVEISQRSLSERCTINSRNAGLILIT